MDENADKGKTENKGFVDVESPLPSATGIEKEESDEGTSVECSESKLAGAESLDNVASSDKNKEKVEEECKFCFEPGTSEDELVVPCKCRGTIGKVHKSCLRNWILEKQHINCEICHEPYQTDETVLSAEESLACRHAFSLQQRRNENREAASSGLRSFYPYPRTLTNFLARHERLSRWINACILMAFSVIMLLVIVFLIYNWNQYYKNRDSVVLVNDVQPYNDGVHVFTGFCDVKRRMMCIISEESIQNTTSLQKRLCNEDEEAEGNPCLRYSTYRFHQTCGSENETCSVMLMPGVQDGVCNALGSCVRKNSFPRGRTKFGSHIISGICQCR